MPAYEDYAILFVLLAFGSPRELEKKYKVGSKWILREFESDIEPNSKLNRSEIESEVEANLDLTLSEFESEHDSGCESKSMLNSK
jgi:hypothetical protein